MRHQALRILGWKGQTTVPHNRILRTGRFRAVRQKTHTSRASCKRRSHLTNFRATTAGNQSLSPASRQERITQANPASSWCKTRGKTSKRLHWQIRRCETGWFRFSQKELDRDSPLTQTFCGTPKYMVPELVRRGDCDTSAGIWALHCLVWELMALRLELGSFWGYMNTRMKGKALGSGTSHTCAAPRVNRHAPSFRDYILHQMLKC